MKASLLFFGALVAACGSEPRDPFWSSLQSLCGKAFQGRLVEGNPGDSIVARSTLRMHVRECSDTVVRIPFHVGDDRSRTWVVRRIPTGMRLKHDHRHPDGTEDAITQYGGDTRDVGAPATREFFADAHTAALIPAAARNVWTMEITDSSFAYALRREGTDRRFRVEFDLARAIDAPPPPWAAVAP